MKKKLFIILLIIGIVLIISGILFWIFGGIEVKLIGNKEINVTYNENYQDSGFKITKYDYEVEKNKYSYKIESNVDTSILGDYKYIYHINYFIKKYDLERTIHVVDDLSPIIKTNIENIERDYCTKKILSKLEYSAIDNYDGDVTEKIEKNESDEGINLKVIDSNGNIATKNILFIDSEKPKDSFTLNGNSIVYLTNGSTYKESGTTYKDGCGNKKNDKVTITGTVDTKKNGEYKITYTVNNLSLTRKVVVYTPSLNEGKANRDKVIYLTFDDGPGIYTTKVLDTLKKYNVKATFFVTHQFNSYVPLIKREYQDGHAVGVHSYTHNWNIYKSVDAYVNDFNKMNDNILKYTGSKSNIFRFPGGSSNTVSRSYAKGVVKAIASHMTTKGYQYFDWDVDSGDAAGASRSKIYSNVVNGVNRCSKCIVLMHDIKNNTVNELDNILKELTSKGYKFGTLSINSPTVHHAIAN